MHVVYIFDLRRVKTFSVVIHLKYMLSLSQQKVRLTHATKQKNNANDISNKNTHHKLAHKIRIHIQFKTLLSKS